MSRFSADRAIGLACLLALTWGLWDTPAAYPVRILVTFLHEISHGLGAIATGGEIVRITVNPDGSGVCTASGGWTWVFLSAGYLGSMAWGCGLLLVATHTRFDRAIAGALGLLLGGVTLFYVRTPFAAVSGLVWAAVFVAGARWLPERGNDLLLRYLGAASCLYALFDLRVLLGLGHGFNDASLFSRHVLPLPPQVWAALWGLASVLCVAQALKWSARE